MLEIQDLLYQLRLSEQASTQLFEKRLGISLTRYQILLFLLKHSPCNQIAVQERLKIDQAALTRHFKILEKEKEMLEIQDLLYQLRLSEQASTQLFEKRLGISLTRYQILLFLLKHSPCNQIAVQERLKIDQAALTRHFKILEKEGLVERHRNPENQREVLVEATKYAKEQLVMNPPLQHIKVKEAMESILTESERTELSRLLNKLVLGIENIEI